MSSKKTIAAVESLARDDERIAATVDQWDIDPMLLNTPGGVIDLKYRRAAGGSAGRLHDQDHRGGARPQLPDAGVG